MADERVPLPYQPGLPIPCPTGLPAQRGTSDAPIHSQGRLHWTGSPATRNDCWQRLSVKARDRVADRLGTLIEWWAQEKDGSVEAVAFGTQALMLLTPTLTADGRPTWNATTVNLDEKSLKSVQLREQGGPAAGGTAVPGVSRGERPGDRPARAFSSGRLDESITGFLGLLPARAQQLIQDPFLESTEKLSFDCYAYRTGGINHLVGNPLQVWCYLTDRKTVTFCAGIGRGYREQVGASSWELTCWQAKAAPRPAGSV